MKRRSDVEKKENENEIYKENMMGTKVNGKEYVSFIHNVEVWSNILCTAPI